jgi:hypothetical protein
LISQVLIFNFLILVDGSVLSEEGGRLKNRHKKTPGHTPGYFLPENNKRRGRSPAIKKGG